MKAAAAAVLVAATLTAAAYAAPAGAAARASARAAATTTRSAHIPFEGCNARRISLSVTIPTHAYTPTQQVTFTVRLRNTGATACGSPLARHVPQARQKLTVGPCGTLALVVHNDRGLEVYPGPGVFHCPEETGFQLGPHATAETTATWSQAVYLGRQSEAVPGHAPPGTYRLLLGGAVTVPVTLTITSG
ncbi:MAG TPA: hypothetical protein VHX67_08950 [Acidimicrobiales bacterium]|jgi:hypothetical protein|nr:hypothetical protein [Acidimicrobiales bacterium]